MAARNVRSVDGMAVEGSSKRMQEIMEEANLRLGFLRGLRGESAKFKHRPGLSQLQRPDVCAAVSRSPVAGRFGWVHRGRERIRGVDTTKLDFTETARPYSIQAADYDLQSLGSASVNGATGTVYRSCYLKERDPRGPGRAAGSMSIWRATRSWGSSYPSR